MSHWHYQVMRHKVKNPNPIDGEEYYAIHEYYEMDDGPGWTRDPVSVDATSVDEMKKTLLMMLNDLERHGVKDYE